MDTETKQTMEQKLTDDGWVVECESPLELRHINGSFISGLSAQELLNRYKRGLRS